MIGLTGSIGMGKSETAKLFAAEGVPVFDADAAIHDLYAGEATGLIEAAFPGVTKNGAVDRAALAGRVSSDGSALARLEGLMHPLVEARQARGFLARYRRADRVAGHTAFAGDRDAAVDAVVVATAPPHVQRQAGSGPPRHDQGQIRRAFLARQTWTMRKKRAQAHYLVMTSTRSLDHAREQVKMILADIRAKLNACEIVFDTETTGFEPSDGHRPLRLLRSKSRH